MLAALFLSLNAYLASLSFPSHPTIALSLPLSLIGLSSLFLSSFSTLPQFSTPQHELNATKYLIFLGILAPIINLFAALFMRVIPQRPLTVHLEEESEDLRSTALSLDERSPLLIGGPEAVRAEVEAMEKGKDVKWTAWGLLHDWEGFWAFGVLMALCIGPVRRPES